MISAGMKKFSAFSLIFFCRFCKFSLLSTNKQTHVIEKIQRPIFLVKIKRFLGKINLSNPTFFKIRIFHLLSYGFHAPNLAVVVDKTCNYIRRLTAFNQLEKCDSELPALECTFLLVDQRLVKHLT